MIIQCKNCSRKFIVKDQDIPKNGRNVQCGYCSDTWHQMPVLIPNKQTIKSKPKKAVEQEIESPSVEKIKASDGKTYKFLGSQWAELLPSGKTGLFAKRKIGQELDKITGRKRTTTIKKRKRKLEAVNPSSINNYHDEKRLPDIYKANQGLGFFGFIFLLIIVGFSLIGILKTFEKDLISYYPESMFIFDMLNQQLEYLSESFKNLIVIISDLISTY